MAARLRRYLRKNLQELIGIETDQLLSERYEKFRKIGVFLEQSSGQSA